MQDIFIGRQAVFDRNQQVSSYELLFRDKSGVIHDNADYMTSKVLVTTLMDIGLEVISDNKLVHINASMSFLLSDEIKMLPADKISIEILETVPVTGEVIEACKKLKKLGYHIMLDDVVYAPNLAPLVELADVIKVELPEIKDLAAEVKALKKFNVKLLAEKVETHEQYKECYDLGFDYFQGYFFCKPEIIAGKSMPESKVNTLFALQEIMNANMVNEVTHVVKRDINLSYRLLKYINSAAFGMRKEVESVDQALVFLGLSNARRWLSLLSMASLVENKPLALVGTALYRGKFLESLSVYLHKDESNDDFLLGMFSVLDALLDQPMCKVISEMALPERVKEALISDQAEFSYKIQLVCALENGQWSKAIELCKVIDDITHCVLFQLHIKAIAWSDSQMRLIS